MAVILLMMTLLSLLGPTTSLARDAPVQEQGRPVQVLDYGYVSSSECRSCHPENHASWHASYHRTMTQVATPEALAIPITQVELKLEGQTYHLKREGDRIWADMPHPSMGRIKRRIVLTTGSHHFQMYWFSSGSTRKLELFPFVYAIQEGRWIPEKSTFLMPPSPSISTQPGRWNQACLQCHTTLGRPRVATQDNMDTQVAEFGIACEACHGPGERHVQVMSRPGSLEAYRRGKLELSIVNPAKLPHDRSSQVCGQCHSVFTFGDRQELVQWLNHGFSYRPGQDLNDSRFLIRYNQSRGAPQMEDFLKAQPRFLESVFWSDGMVRTAGREYSGLLESGCYQVGQMS
ncbi:MAG: multiheme c-type cytochrome, partial [Acidobacteriota bacterium]|nr:multiheme c-type cytochrome [Acidobacteriota bacterium]